jgi:hypothetical protein
MQLASYILARNWRGGRRGFVIDHKPPRISHISNTRGGDSSKYMLARFNLEVVQALFEHALAAVAHVIFSALHAIVQVGEGNLCRQQRGESGQ